MAKGIYFNLFLWGLILFFLVARRIPPGTAVVVYRLGRPRGVKMPGFTFMLPFLDHIKVVPLNGQTLEHRIHALKTIDGPFGALIHCHFAVKDPMKAVENVADYREALGKLCEAKLNEATRSIGADEFIEHKDSILARALRAVKQSADQWGLEIAAAELVYVDPHPDTQAALKKRLSQS